ncbi:MULTISPECIES: septal ring lytic transglycosylase RlpA family protein [Methylobacterium]|uniref:septal ring lytic transglycosylase RlpA family protein n=1 Tax=Methylobacterium TaxID=407 RepID=UPI0019332644|nr:MULTISPECIES: septal ring lytic transglycosylase RlpA family protein [Methylobacterium]MCF4129381.1 septal ring lytic transglycosylase RlpA family protein [Methylobacterium sp. SyP6R]QRE76971.1 septal ring lytic transglycosylase RlpA family protein [Methylobacterium aquaticum]
MNSAQPARRSNAARIVALAGGVALAGFSSLAGVSTAQAQSGKASWYASGHRTASGERFNPNGLTAAHRSLPFGTRVRVTNQSNGRSVVVRINDRGPFAHGRIIDLARGAGRAIGMNGVARVAVAVVD